MLFCVREQFAVRTLGGRNMFALRLSHILTGATLGLLVAAIPATAAAQSCAARSCTAVNYVQVTVPTRLALSATAPQAMVRANTAWRLQVSTGETRPAIVAAGTATAYVQVRDTPSLPAAAVRYTLVGS
jgi:hypothetical protein